ncbi:hypothetical protein ES703_72741 [subsurface metagenome]
MKSLEETKIIALKHSRNLHNEFVRYLLGQMTFGEFIDELRKRERDFEHEVQSE